MRSFSLPIPITVVGIAPHDFSTFPDDLVPLFADSTLLATSGYLRLHSGHERPEWVGYATRYTSPAHGDNRPSVTTQRIHDPKPTYAGVPSTTIAKVWQAFAKHEDEAGLIEVLFTRFGMGMRAIGYTTRHDRYLQNIEQVYRDGITDPDTLSQKVRSLHANLAHPTSGLLMEQKPMTSHEALRTMAARQNLVALWDSLVFQTIAPACPYVLTPDAASTPA